MIPVQIQFVSDEAKNLYNGKLEYATEGSSGFDLRAIEFEWNPTIEKVIAPDTGEGTHFEPFTNSVDLSNVDFYQSSQGEVPRFLLRKQGRILIKTGIKVKLLKESIYLRGHSSREGEASSFLQEIQYEIQIRPRSGLALKYGITILNTPGTIDSDYNKEIGVILYNASHDTFEIKKGDRIAQAVICPILRGNFQYVDDIEDSGRGGYGSTGVE